MYRQIKEILGYTPSFAEYNFVARRVKDGYTIWQALDLIKEW